MLTVDIERLPSFNRGLKKGIQEGIESTLEKVAIGMLALNVDIEIIQKTTGLSLEEIEKLRSKV
jgi:predicted transposase/invertase (TIGR01784 family)